LEGASIRVLVVDDYEPFRRFISDTLRNEPEFLVICEVADGLEAVEKGQQLQPDLILLDIGLPTLNGIEAARRLRVLSPTSKIVFVSDNRSWDIAQEALFTGAGGYVVKSEVAHELLHAVESVLNGKRFVSPSLSPNDVTGPETLSNVDVPLDKRVAGMQIEVFSAGCELCEETIKTVKRFAGLTHKVVVRDLHKPDVASKARDYGIRSAPAVVIDGKLASCCGRGPDEDTLRSFLEAAEDKC
jgi:DNA-binding NarL/FixJ family response regulator